jgi:hypothetical protein
MLRQNEVHQSPTTSPLIRQPSCKLAEQECWVYYPIFAAKSSQQCSTSWVWASSNHILWESRSSWKVISLSYSTGKEQSQQEIPSNKCIVKTCKSISGSSSISYSTLTILKSAHRQKEADEETFPWLLISSFRGFAEISTVPLSSWQISFVSLLKIIDEYWKISRDAMLCVYGRRLEIKVFALLLSLNPHAASHGPLDPDPNHPPRPPRHLTNYWSLSALLHS